MKMNSAVLHAMLLILSLMAGEAVLSQPNASAWGSVFINGPYKNRWGLHVDAQVRSNDQMDQLKTWLFRPGLQYQLNRRHTFSVGYAYIHGITRQAFVPTAPSTDYGNNGFFYNRLVASNCSTAFEPSSVSSVPLVTWRE